MGTLREEAGKRTVVYNNPAEQQGGLTTKQTRVNAHTNTINHVLSDATKVSEKKATKDQKADIFKTVFATALTDLRVAEGGALSPDASIAGREFKKPFPLTLNTDDKNYNHFRILECGDALAREVVSDYTPGTVIDEHTLTQYDAAYQDLYQLSGLTKKNIAEWFTAALQDHAAGFAELKAPTESLKETTSNDATRYTNKGENLPIQQNNKKIWFLANYNKALSEIDALTQEKDKPKLRHLAYTYLVPVAAYGEKHKRDLSMMFFNNNPIEDIKSAIKTDMEESYARVSKSVKAEKDIHWEPAEIIAYHTKFNKNNQEQLSPHHNINIGHGGDLYYILNFLMGDEAGYALEQPEEGTKNQATIGIQVQPHFTINNEKFYDTPLLHDRLTDDYPMLYTSFLAYPALFTAKIDAQHLDAANNLYEAGLRSRNRECLKNIKITLLKRDKISGNPVTDLSSSEDTKRYLVSHIEGLIQRLKSSTNSSNTQYTQGLINALNDLVRQINPNDSVTPAPHPSNINAHSRNHKDTSQTEVKNTRPLVNQDDGEDWYQQALRYKNGDGVNKDDVSAFNCFNWAATHGHKQAQLELFFCYSQGKGVKQNPQKAKEYLDLASAIRR